MGVEYYGIYDENGQHPGPFAKFLKNMAYVFNTQCLEQPQQNAVVKRRNCTLMDMVRSIISNSFIPLSLWMYALSIAVYLLNMVPSKAFQRLFLNYGLVGDLV